MARPKAGQEKKYTAPTAEEILTYDNVPVAVAAKYIGWTETALRLALREGRADFGMAVMGEGRLTFNISPGGLVKYKREGLTVVPFESLQELLAESVTRLVDAKLDGLNKVLHLLIGTGQNNIA